MGIIKTDIVIIGGGLTGLALAYFLKDSPWEVHVVEARDRWGGRILTSYKENNPPIEMGATWFADKHEALNALLDALGVIKFKQHVDSLALYQGQFGQNPLLFHIPENQEPSYRIAKGSFQLITSLLKFINKDHAHLNEPISRIKQTHEGIVVTGSEKQFKARVVVSTLPPNLLMSSITFVPALPKNVISLASATHTWMGDSIKMGMAFTDPFWRAKGNTGTAFSNQGPIIEMYDHTDKDAQFFALKGFLNSVLSNASLEERRALVIKQLQQFYGDQIPDTVAYHDKVWQQEVYTFSPYKTALVPHQNNGHPLYHESFYNNSFWIAGTETSTHFPGYMEGAILSAKNVYKALQESTVLLREK